MTTASEAAPKLPGETDAAYLARARRRAMLHPAGGVANGVYIDPDSLTPYVRLPDLADEPTSHPDEWR